MKAKTLLVTSLGLFISGVLWAADATKPATSVDVVFIQPGEFTDVSRDGYASGRDQDGILSDLKAHVEKMAHQYLKEGQVLSVRFTDIDLAGGFEPWRGHQYNDIRIVKEIYPPRMDLEFKLTSAEGKIISEGKRQLRELGYLSRMVLPNNDPMRFDKQMLEDWMRREFGRSS